MQNIYSTLKPLFYPDQLQAIRTASPIAPVHVRIKPINACNHHCWFCAYRADGLTLGDQMQIKDRIPQEKMREIVDDLIAMKVKAVTFSGGGEPLIYPHIVETVDRLARGGIKIGTLTNGAFLKGPVADVYARHASWVRVSMDSWDGPSCAKSRGVKDDEFQKIIGNMQNFLSQGGPCVLGVSFIISKENAEHIYDFCKIVKGIGVKHVKLAGCVVANTGVENNRYHAEFKATVYRQIEKCMTLNDEHFLAVNHYHDMAERFDKDYETCPMQKFLTIIGADCSVYTCQDKAYTDSGNLGSIRDRSFRDFWMDPATSAKIAAFNPKESCKHYCVAHRKNELLVEAVHLDQGHVDFV